MGRNVFRLHKNTANCAFCPLVRCEVRDGKTAWNECVVIQYCQETAQSPICLIILKSVIIKVCHHIAMNVYRWKILCDVLLIYRVH